MILNLVTDYGDLDVLFSPAGPTGDYEGWRRHASEVEVSDGVVVYVGGLDDIIASKSAANRLKDQRDLPYLESLRDELKRR